MPPLPYSPVKTVPRKRCDDRCGTSRGKDPCRQRHRECRSDGCDTPDKEREPDPYSRGTDDQRYAGPERDANGAGPATYLQDAS